MSELKNFVEVDVRLIDGQIYLGHDCPQYKVSKDFFLEDSDKFYIHCKNAEALNFFYKNNLGVEFFFHEDDEYTITSKGNIWIHPKASLIKGGILVMPEKRFDIKDANLVMAVCSDYVEKFKK